MERFSITEVALTGFRVVRERPRIVLFWAAAQLVVSACMMVVMVAAAGPALGRLANLRTLQPHATPAETLAQFEQVLPAYLAMLAFMLVFSPVVLGAMNRAVLRPEQDRFGYLRLGMDELRQFGLLLLAMACGVLAYALLVLALAVAIALAGVVGVAAFGRSAPLAVGALVAVAVTAAVIAAACACVYVGVRLSLASPMTFATGRVDLFGSWRLTRRIFWPALGSYLVALVLSLSVWLLYTVIVAALDMAVGGGVGGLSAALQPNMSSLAAYLSPVIVLNLLLGAGMTAMMWPIVMTPPVAIYQRMTLADVSGVFA